MIATIVDFSRSFDGKQRVTFETDEDAKAKLGDLFSIPCEVSVKKYREKRSLDANALLWLYCEKIANAINSTKEAVYRDQIRQVGEYTPLPIKENAVDEFSYIWSKHGIGWFTEVVDNSKLPGYKLVFAYAGSSTYDTKQMSRLIDSVMNEAKNLGIDTLSEKERSLLIDALASS